MIGLSIDEDVECGEQGAGILACETVIKFLIVPENDGGSKEVLVLDRNFVLTKFPEVCNASLMIVNSGIELEIWELNPLIYCDTGTVLVAGEGGEMPSRRCEDGIKKRWTPTGTLRNDQRKGLFGIANVELGQSAIIKAGRCRPYPRRKLCDEVSHQASALRRRPRVWPVEVPLPYFRSQKMLCWDCGGLCVSQAAILSRDQSWDLIVLIGDRHTVVVGWSFGLLRKHVVRPDRIVNSRLPLVNPSM